MGKQVTVKAGFTYVSLPGVYGISQYNGGDTVVLTDAEYAGLSASQLNSLGSSTNVAEPNRPSTDSRSIPSSTVNYTTGALALAAGQAFVVNLGANVASVTLSGATAGNYSVLRVLFVQDATGSRTVTWPASVKGAPTLTTTANKRDFVQLATFDGGTNWFVTDTALNL